jgi:ADP-ribosylarginine hydrolase
MINQFKATMVLAAVGDAMGYRRGMWEFNKKGVKIHEDMMNMTDQAGIKGLKLNYTDFPYSDDTVMHIATA